MADKKKAGAPPKSGVDLLKTQVWVRRLMQVSGLLTGYALEMALDPSQRDAAGIARPKKWDAYIKGRRCPKPIEGRPYSVDLAEARYPGTRAVFDSPAWKFLAGERLTVADIDGGICALGPVVSVWVPGIGGRPTSKAIPDFDARCAKALAGLGNIEALLALVLLIAKAEAVASPDLREIALSGYWLIQPHLIRQEVMAPVLPSLFLAIDLRGKHWTHPSNQSRMDIVIFSDATRDGLDAEAAGETTLIRTQATTQKTRWIPGELPLGVSNYFTDETPTAASAAPITRPQQKKRRSK